MRPESSTVNTGMEVQSPTPARGLPWVDLLRGMEASIYISRRVADQVKAGSSCLSCTPGQAWSGIQLLAAQAPDRERGTGHQAGTLQKYPGAERRVAPTPPGTLVHPQSWKAGIRLSTGRLSVHLPISPLQPWVLAFHPLRC